jgi:uncharacterized membrane protein YccC
MTAMQNSKRARPIAGRIQLILILLLPVSLVLIAQQANRDLYRVGVLSLIVLTLFQIAFGNIPARYDWKRTLLSVIIAAAIIGGIVFLSINLVPTLIRIGR